MLLFYRMPQQPAAPPSHQRVTRASSNKSANLERHTNLAQSRSGRDDYRSALFSGVCPSNHCNGELVSCVLVHINNSHPHTLFPANALIKLGLTVCARCGLGCRNKRGLKLHDKKCNGSKVYELETALNSQQHTRHQLARASSSTSPSTSPAGYKRGSTSALASPSRVTYCLGPPLSGAQTPGQPPMGIV